MNGLKVPLLRSLLRLDFREVECLQVLDRTRSAEVEGVLAQTNVACLVALPLRDVGEFVFDRGALAQRLASSGGLNLLAQPRLKLLVFSNGDRPSMAKFCGGALRTHGTAIAHVGVELNDRAERKALHLALGAFDRPVAKIELEGRFGEQAAIVRLPRFAHNVPAPAEHVVHEGAVDIAAIDQQMIDVESLAGHVPRQGGHRLLLGAIRGRDGAREDQPPVDVSGNVTLESIEPLAFALAAVPHLRVLDRDASIFRNAGANAHAVLGVRFQILRADLHEGR